MKLVGLIMKGRTYLRMFHLGFHLPQLGVHQLLLISLDKMFTIGSVFSMRLLGSHRRNSFLDCLSHMEYRCPSYSNLAHPRQKAGRVGLLLLACLSTLFLHCLHFPEITKILHLLILQKDKGTAIVLPLVMQMKPLHVWTFRVQIANRHLSEQGNPHMTWERSISGRKNGIIQN